MEILDLGLEAYSTLSITLLWLWHRPFLGLYFLKYKMRWLLIPPVNVRLDNVYSHRDSQIAALQ